MTNLNELWFHIIDNLLTGLAFTVLAIVFLLAMRKRGVGYRSIFGFGFMFFFTRAILFFDLAIEHYFGHPSGTLWIGIPVALNTFVFALYCWHHLPDLVIALRRIEFGKRLELNVAADNEQRRTQLAYLASLTRAESERSLTWAEQRESTHERPDIRFTHPHAAMGGGNR